MKYLIWFLSFALIILFLEYFDPPFPVFVNICILVIILLLYIPVSIYFFFFRKKGLVLLYFICVFTSYYLIFLSTTIISDTINEKKIAEFAPEKYEYQHDKLTPEQQEMIDYSTSGDGARYMFRIFVFIPAEICAVILYFITRIVKFFFKIFSKVKKSQGLQEIR